jgi:hypothetical protein
VGCDAGTYQSGDGVLIYHIDDAKIAATLADNTVEGTRSGRDRRGGSGRDQDLDDLLELQRGSPDDVFRAGWRDEFTPTTRPSTSAYPSVRTGIAVTSISAPDSLMTMNVTFRRDRNGWPKTLGGRIRSLATVAADLDGDDSLELIVPIQRLNNTGAVYVPRGQPELPRWRRIPPFAITTAAPTSGRVRNIDGVPGPNRLPNLDSKICPANGTGCWTATRIRRRSAFSTPPGSLTTRAVVLADLDGDGRDGDHHRQLAPISADRPCG